MKTKDLMLYDWVQVPSELNRFKQIKSTFDMDEAVLYQPIPLTEEILKKNGFLLHNSASYFKEYMWTTGGIDEYADVYIEVGKDQQDNWRWDNLKCKLHFFRGDVFLVKMQYVHELQHALRICHIDKEIVL